MIKAASGNRAHTDVDPLGSWERPAVERKDAVWLFGPVPPGYWDQRENRRRYLVWLGNQLGYRRPEDWYNISTEVLKRNRGGGALRYGWNSSAVAAVMESFPDHDWKEWLFAYSPRSFWQESGNHRRYMAWLEGQLGIKSPDDWYKVTNRDFTRHKGGAFLLHYHSTISAAIMAFRPNHDWKEWLFAKTPKGFWDSRHNRLRYMRWLGQRLGCQRPEDWYRVTRNEFHAHYGIQFLKLYDGSPTLAVKDCFPDHPWNEWMFARVPLGFWNSRHNRRRYMRWLGQQVGVRRAADWLNVRRSDFLQNCGGGLLAQFKSHMTLILEHVPALQCSVPSEVVAERSVETARPPERSLAMTGR